MGHGHAKRLEILQDKRYGFSAFCKHYEALLEASEVARYLGSTDKSTKSTTTYVSFSSYMAMADVKSDLLKKRLMNVETHARAFLSDAGKKSLRQISSETF